MPAILSRAVEAGVHVLQAREWRQTVGQSGMTPTAFAFLIPVFIVAIATPFLCVFCIRKRRRTQPYVPAAKKPALRRAEARERLNSVTEVSNEASEIKLKYNGTIEENDGAVESASFAERECAICLSTLHAPSLPEPAKLSKESVLDEATQCPSVKDVATSEPEAILKLHVCGHEFHAECLVSWFVLRKTSCPICRAVYYSKEAMQTYDDENHVDTQSPTTLEAQAPAPTISNWRYFIHGHNVFYSQTRTVLQPMNQPD